MPDVVQPPSKEVVTQTADKIVKLECVSQLDLDIKVGRLIVESFYGTLEVWNQRNIGDQAVEALAKALVEKGSELTRNRLYRAVRLYEQWVNLGDFAEWPLLMPSHFLQVQGLPWDQQRELLTRANAEKWSVRALDEVVGPKRPAAAPATGSPKQEALRNLKALERRLDQRDHLLADLTEAGVPAESSERLLKALEAFQAELARVRQDLTPKASAGSGKSAAVG